MYCISFLAVSACLICLNFPVSVCSSRSLAPVSHSWTHIQGHLPFYSLSLNINRYCANLHSLSHVLTGSDMASFFLLSVYASTVCVACLAFTFSLTGMCSPHMLANYPVLACIIASYAAWHASYTSRNSCGPPHIPAATSWALYLLI